jgi:hypothetical protein
MIMKCGILSIKFKTQFLFITKIQRLKIKILSPKTFFGKITISNTISKINSKKTNKFNKNINRFKI